MNLEEIQKLRKETGLGVMECKNAFQEAAGNYSGAKEILKKRGFEKAEQKSQRQTQKGLIESYSHHNRIGVLLELLCETDFVAKNKEFKNLAHDLALQIASMAPKNEKELFSQVYIRDESMTVEDLLKSKVALLGENIVIKRFERWEL